MHAIVVAGSRTALRGVVELGRNGERPLLRFQPFARGDLVVLAPSGARIDGRPMVGGLAVVDWGSGAVVRALDLRVEVRWERARETRGATEDRRCAICFDALAALETVVACSCETIVHQECFAATISCPSCGDAA